MTAARTRSVACAVGLTVALGVLVGVLGRMTVFVPITMSDSTVEARLAAWLVVATFLVIVACYVLLPVGIAAVRARRDGRWARHAGAATLAVFGPPLAIVAIGQVVRRALDAGFGPRVTIGAAVVVVCVALVTTALVVAGALGRVPFSSPFETAAWPVAANVAVVVLFLVGFVAVQPLAGGFADAHVDSYGGMAGPWADFEVDERSVGNDTLVTFTHAGGDPLHSDRLSVRGEGFADVDGADHAGPGVWNGTVSGERPRRGGPAVVRGDSVTVGVGANCTVTLVYEEDGDRSAVGHYRCGRS